MKPQFFSKTNETRKLVKLTLAERCARCKLGYFVITGDRMSRHFAMKLRCSAKNKLQSWSDAFMHANKNSGRESRRLTDLESEETESVDHQLEALRHCQHARN